MLADARAASLGRRPKLGQEVTRELRDALLSGRFSPGERMMVDVLARSLGVSTMPVREALVALAGEGLVSQLPRRGFRAAEFLQRDIEDNFRIHGFVAGLLAAEAARSINDSALAELRRVQESIESVAGGGPLAAAEALEVEQLNHEFHRQVNRVCKSPRLLWYMRAATRYVPRNFYLEIPRWVQATLDDHPRILEALEAHDAVASEKLMVEHTLHAGELMVEHLVASKQWSSRWEAGWAPEAPQTGSVDPGRSEIHEIGQMSNTPPTTQA